MRYRRIGFALLILSWLGGLPINQAKPSKSSIPQRTGKLDWEGVYRFAETGGKNTGLVIDYSIKVYRKDGVLVADIDADGHQTLTRISCDTRVEGHRLTLSFKNYREENLFELYKPGEVLLSLERKNRKLLTYWGAMHPQLSALKSGRVYFERQ
jgi:hypothetical protein